MTRIQKNRLTTRLLRKAATLKVIMQNSRRGFFNLGMPLDYRMIAGAGVFTLIYIVSRAIGKIGGAFAGGKITKAEPAVTKYL